MSFQIDFRTLPSNVPSLCIPRVFTNWTEQRIRRVFDELGMGEILRIDVVGKNTGKGEKFNRVFVHFKRWFSNQNADMARERLLNGKDIKIVYDDPWFWKVSAYREPTKKVDHPPNKEERPRATIQFDDDDRRPSERDRPIAPSLPKSYRKHEDRERDRPSERDRPIAPSLPKSYRKHEDRECDRRPRKPRNDNTKEALDRQPEKNNPTIPQSTSVDMPETSSPKIDEVGAGDIVYDMADISYVKRHNILKTKHTTKQKPPLKIDELEEGEIAEDTETK